MIPMKKLLEISEFAINNGFEATIKNEYEAKFAAKRVFVKYKDDSVTTTIHSCEDVSVSFFELDVATFGDAAQIARMLHDNRDLEE